MARSLAGSSLTGAIAAAPAGPLPPENPSVGIFSHRGDDNIGVDSIGFGKMSLLVRAWTVLKYVSIGCFIWFAGALFFGDGTEFRSRSEPVQLVVLDVQSRRDGGGLQSYRPVLALAAAESPGSGYAGDIWSRFKPHEPGDIVPGRYDPASGEMRSDKMLGRTIWLGRIARVFGLLVGLQAVLILLGFPEDRLPLRVRIGSRRRRVLRV